MAGTSKMTTSKDSGFRDYFNNEKYSDVTIRVNGEDIKAHKLVLAQGSDYFKACFDSGFKEAIEGVVHLQGDDTKAVGRLIQLLYGCPFEDLVRDVESQSGPREMYVVDIVPSYVVGQKYLAPTVCETAIWAFTRGLAAVSEESATNVFGKVAKCVYVDYRDEARDLRELVVGYFMAKLTKTALHERFRALFNNIPDLAFDVTNAFVQKKIARDDSDNDSFLPPPPAKKPRKVRY